MNKKPHAIAVIPGDGIGNEVMPEAVNVLEAVGRLDEALPLYRRAHQLDPEDPQITADFERTQHP